MIEKPETLLLSLDQMRWLQGSISHRVVKRKVRRAFNNSAPRVLGRTGGLAGEAFEFNSQKPD